MPQGESTEGVRAVLQKLANARLVTTFEDEAEVAHEALIREWPALRGWLEEDREALRVQRRLGEAAREWQDHDQEESYLYRGAQLVQAEEMGRTCGDSLSRLEAAFLAASLALREWEAEEQERRQRERLETAEALAREQQQRAEEQAAAAGAMRRRNRVLAVALVAAVIAALGAGIFFVQANTAREKAQRAATTEASARQAAEDRTTIAELLLGVQRDFLAQAETRGMSAAVLDQQRQRLEQGASVLDSGVAPRLTVPDVVGMNYAEAVPQFEQGCNWRPCLRAQVLWETSDEIAGGLVLGTDPPAGAALLWGSAVTLTVSQGKPLVIESPVRLKLMPVPAGEFLMGSDPLLDPNADADEAPQHTVRLSEFYIGQTEVSNDQYAAFLEATAYDAPENWEDGKAPAGKEDHPAVNVSWNDAVAFTQWLSEESGLAFRLCTEAEWEKACRGTTGLTYPWADTFDASKANTLDSGLGATTATGIYSPHGDSPYGVADMAGNVWDWVADWYANGYYEMSPANNPQGPQTGDDRVLRGGSFRSDAWFARCAFRLNHNPSDWSDFSGFRVCVSAGLSTTGLRPPSRFAP